jgi:8-oxo-dGTP pyrophosphatase MutT (NUDIX family)
VDATFRLLDRPVDERLTASVYVVAFVGGDCLMAHEQRGEWLLLGGTLEPGESWRAALERELLEEAGASLATMPSATDPTVAGVARVALVAQVC